MSDILWVLPVPATGLIQSPLFAVFPKRRCELSFDYEDDEGEIKSTLLLFDGVEAYKCTYLTSLSADMIDRAYGKVVKVHQSNWLSETKENHSKRKYTTQKDIYHLMICFDDGPCYEFICESFRAS